MMGIQEYAWPQENLLIDTHEGYVLRDNFFLQVQKNILFVSLTEFGLSVMPILKSFSEWNKKNTRTISVKLNKNFEESRIR